jgi:glutathione synthase/RimK-type ligase-like ATP-grasp enzyme
MSSGSASTGTANPHEPRAHTTASVLIRTDPPFDSAYLHLTLLLDHLAGQTLVVNSLRGLRDANEKLYDCRFPDVMPPTIVTADHIRSGLDQRS